VTKTSDRRGTGARALFCAILSAALLWALEAPQLLEAEIGGRAAAFEFAGALFACGVLLAAVLDLTARIGAGSSRALSPRRLLIAALAALAIVPLGFSLGSGAGLSRAGLSWLPPLVLPCAAGGGLLLLMAVGSRLRGGLAQRVGGLILIGLAFAARAVNARLFVGLYASVHDALFVVELLLLGFGFTRLLGPWPRPLPPRSARVWLAAYALVLPLAILLCGLALSILPPALKRGPGPLEEESMRAALGRQGFHAARFLRWAGPSGGGVRDLDLSLAEGIAPWNERVAEYEMPVPGEGDWNVLWISVDTLRADRCGFIPGSRRRGGKSLTPHLDRLAARSAVFESAYSPYPSTHLSAEATFTGRYPRGTALYRRLTNKTRDGDSEPIRLPAALREGGLATAATIAFTDIWMSHPAFAEKLADFEFLNHERPGGPDLDARHFVVSARKTLEEIGDRRFFLWFHVFEPHAPYEAHREFEFGREPAELYDAEVAYADARIGELLAEIERRKLSERTVIVFSSDHGEALGEKEIRYHGSALSEVQLRVPMMIAVPGREGQKRSELVTLVDLYPTTLRLAGLESPPTQGRDLRPLIDGDEELARDFPNFAYAELPDDVKELSSSSSNVAMLRSGKWKLVRHLSEGYGELFDLEADPEESVDLAAREPAIKARLEAQLAGLATKTASFGRDEGADEKQARRLASMRDRLKSKQGELSEILGVLTECAGLDDASWLLVAEEVASLAASSEAEVEARRLALLVLSSRGHEGAEDLCVQFAHADDPVLRWAGLRDSWRLPALPKTLLQARPDDEEGPLFVERSALSLAQEGRRAPEDLLVQVRRQARDIDLDRGSVRRSLLALALAADPQLDCDQLLSQTWNRVETQGILSALEAAKHPLAPVLVERLVRDRYLFPELRNAVLEAVPSMPRGRALRVGRHLLAGWDPGFHLKAQETYRAIFGMEVTRALSRAHQLESECRAVAKKQTWSDLPLAYRRLLQELPEGDFDDIHLDTVRAELAAGDYEAAAARVAARFEGRGDRVGDDLRRRRAWAEMRAARLDEGKMRPEERLRVTAVAVQRGARTRILPGREFRIRVRLANDAERALPGGVWPGTGRVRVLWFQSGRPKAQYGTELPLTRGLLPGESEDRVFSFRAPAAPGVYRGRIIVSQHMGARFFPHEDPKLSEFDLRVLGPEDLRTPLDLEGAELALNLPPPTGVESWGADAEGQLWAVMTSPGVAMTLGPLNWRAEDRLFFHGKVNSGAKTLKLKATLRGARGELSKSSALQAGERRSRSLGFERAMPEAFLMIEPGGRAGLLSLRQLRLAPKED
jgi:arylsulfatase A-like enzyme